VPAFEHSELTPELLDEWWSYVSDLEFQAAALATLATMWDGAISVISGDRKNQPISFTSVKGLLADYGLPL